MRAPLVLTAAIALLAGALATPALATEGVADAVFMHTCAPTDELALQVNMPAPDGRRLEMRIWGEALETLATGQMLMLSMNPNEVRANKDIAICSELGCEPTKGQLRIGIYRANDFLDGELLWHNNGEVKSLPFTAHYDNTPTPCG